MVPFYGQGMNAGMEDVRVLFSIIDKHHLQDDGGLDGEKDEPTRLVSQRLHALTEYSLSRAPDAYAINDLALQNYVEMRSSVLSRRYRLRKYLEEFMSIHFPSFGWQTKYARVSFSNEGYLGIIQKSDYQGKALVYAFFTLASSPVLVAVTTIAYRSRRYLWSFFTGQR